MGAPCVLVVEHQADAGIGHFGERLVRAGLELTVVGPDSGGAVPESLNGVDALIVLGGSMGPLDDHTAPWLPATRALLAEAVGKGVPTLGICLGAQLLATATGGHVRTMPEGPEVGLLRVRVDEQAAADPLFGAYSGGDFSAVQWHWLEADQLPAHATALASSGSCKNQVFRVGERAWGVQFHPEALGDTAAEWAVETGDELLALGLDRDVLVTQVRDAEPTLRQTWGHLAERFAELVQEAAACSNVVSQGSSAGARRDVHAP